MRHPPPLEWQEHRALIQWAQLHAGQEPRLQWLYHIPNGEWRAPRTAAKLQQMGVKPGVPDLCLPIPVRHGADPTTPWAQWHGCYLELKRATATATLTPEQGAWCALLSQVGYAVYTAQGWLDAARYLCWYLQRPDLAAALA